MEDAAVERAATSAALGHRGRLSEQEIADLEAAARDDVDPRCRAAALAALVRAAPGPHALGTWRLATLDPSVMVRSRGADVAPELATRPGVDATEIATALVSLLNDAQVMVVVAAAWALGELDTEGGSDFESARASMVASLCAVTTDHPDALAREAAVAALGSLGDARAVPAILTACSDSPTVRRRAVLALAPFDGPEVTAALETAPRPGTICTPSKAANGVTSLIRLSIDAPPCTSMRG